MESLLQNNLAQDLCLLSEGKYGKITSWNVREVAGRIAALILYHSGQSQHVEISRAMALELAVRAIKRDLPQVAERMHVDLLMADAFDRTDPEELDMYQNSFLASLVNNIEIETAGLKTDKAFFDFERARLSTLSKL